MPVVKSFSVGSGDMFYIKHGSDNFSIIDCCLNDDRRDEILDEIINEKKDKGITRFISTHPDEDHIRGLHHLHSRIDILNFYCVENKAIKDDQTDSFDQYCALRDSTAAFNIFKGCSRKWMNQNNDERGASGINILWPNTSNPLYAAALQDAAAGIAFNNISAVIRYSVQNGPSFMWLGDLETDFMESIVNDVNLEETHIVFAAHHGRDSGRIPHSWLDKLQPEIIIIGEAPSRHLHYYTGYQTITQNTAGDITMECDGDRVHFHVSESGYGLCDFLVDENRASNQYYIGTLLI